MLQAEEQPFGNAEVSRQPQIGEAVHIGAFGNDVGQSRGVDSGALATSATFSAPPMPNSSRRNSPGCTGGNGSASMIILDAHIFRRSIGPAEWCTPLVVDANAICASAAALQGLEPVAGRVAQIVERFGFAEEDQLALCGSGDVWWEAADAQAGEQGFGVLVGKAANQALYSELPLSGPIGQDSTSNRGVATSGMPVAQDYSAADCNARGVI
jgi:hypothetical protein